MEENGIGQHPVGGDRMALEEVGNFAGGESIDVAEQINEGEFFLSGELRGLTVMIATYKVLHLDFRPIAHFQPPPVTGIKSAFCIIIKRV